ncbi:RHS repeat-associated core domain-containing protein [Streptomyces sp. NPDC054842]
MGRVVTLLTRTATRSAPTPTTSAAYASWPSPTASPATTRAPPASTTSKARYYDANIGRFTQPDPSGQEQNPYQYAEGDPPTASTPRGCCLS